MVISKQGKIIVLAVLLAVVLIIVGKPMLEEASNDEQMSAVQQINRAQEGGLGIWLLVGSGTCSYCVEMSQIFTQLEPDYEENIAFIKVDVYDPENEGILINNDVRVIPTSIFIN